MEKDIIDLSYLTEEERVQIMAVIDADLDLRVQGLSFSQYKDQNRLGLRQLQLKLEGDHRCASELIRKSLMAVSEQNSDGIIESNLLSREDNMKENVKPVKELPEVPDIGQYKEEYNCQALTKSSSSESLDSMYSASAGKEGYDITGRVKLEVWYKNGQLFVHVLRAEGLAATKEGGAPNPYVKIYLLPDCGKHSKRKTSVCKKRTNPDFDETLKIKVEQSQLGSRILWVSVWDWDKYGRNQFLGEVRLPLSSCDLTYRAENWYTLQDENESSMYDDLYKGRLRVGLMYEPQTKVISSNGNTSRISGTLHIAIHQAECLPVIDENGLDATAKMYLLPNQSSSGKRKTKVVDNSQNPVWDEMFTYEHVYMDDLSSKRTLEVTVWDYDRRGSNDFIGGLHIGPDSSSDKDWMDSSGDEVTHWEAMLEKPGEWVEQWHDLRPSMKPASKYYVPYQPTSTHPYQPKSTHPYQPKSTHDGKLHNTHNLDDFPLPRASESTTLDGLPTEEERRQSKTPDETNDSHQMNRHDISGEVLVGVFYKTDELHIHINQARGLASADINGYSDPYIKTYLLPDKDKQTKQKTSIKKKTLDPVYNETLKYYIPKSDLTSRTLSVSVWDWDRFASNDFLGEVQLHLSSLDLTDTADHWYKLQDKYDGNQTKESPEQLKLIRRSVDGAGNNDLEATETLPEHHLDVDAAQIKDI